MLYYEFKKFVKCNSKDLIHMYVHYGLGRVSNGSAFFIGATCRYLLYILDFEVSSEVVISNY
jgi:hypothetical protein